MFRTLHKTAIFLLWAMGAAIAFWAFQHRAALDPIEDWVDVLKNKKEAPQIYQGQISGTVTKIIDGDTFYMRDAQGQLYAVGMTGIFSPDRRSIHTPRQALLFAESRENLSNLILSNKVVVDVTFATPQRAALGFVRLGETNVNEAVARAGWGEIKRHSIRTLPAVEQMRLISAEREARTEKRGIWEDERPEDPPFQAGAAGPLK